MREPNQSATTDVLRESSPAEILQDLFVAPRAAVHKWAERTNQTTQAKTAYLGQHLASVLTAVPGEGTAARGNDLVDGSEVKTCSRADQLGQCKNCEAPVPSWWPDCRACGSPDIDRKTDSHWIFAVRSEEELAQYLAGPRTVMILFDRVGLHDIRVRAWEIWPSHEQHAYFGLFLTDYYNNNYLVKGARAAPANLHPLKFDHLMMNPVRIFDALVRQVDEPDSTIEIVEHFDPRADRDGAPVEAMPPSLCKADELVTLLQNTPQTLESGLRQGKSLSDLEQAVKRPGGTAYRSAVDSVLEDVPAAARILIPMRGKRIKTSASSYQRRSAG